MSSHRLGSRSLPSISLDGIERATELLEYRLTPADSDDLTLTDPFAAQEWTLTGRAYQSLDRTSLYRFARDHSGEDLAFTLRPHGNEIATEDEPHYRGTLTVGPRPELGGAATDRFFIFEFVWRVREEPEEVTA